MTTPGPYRTVGITGIGTGFDFSQVTGMVETFKNAELVNPETLYAPGSFGAVTDMRGCWYNPLASGPQPGHSNHIYNISGEPYALPTMDLSSVTDIRSGFTNFARYNAVTPDFLSGLDLSSVAGHGLERTFDGAFSVDPFLSHGRTIIMPDLGLNVANSLTSLRQTFRSCCQVTGVSLFNTSNVTNFDMAFDGVFSGLLSTTYGDLNTPGSNNLVISGAPLHVRDGVTGLVFPAFDMSAGTGFLRTFQGSYYNGAMGFMSRDFSSAVNLNQTWSLWWLAPNGPPLPASHLGPYRRAQTDWAMPDTPSGEFPTIAFPAARSISWAWSLNQSFDVFPEIDFSTVWGAFGAFYGAYYMRECKSWNFGNIDQSEAWWEYPAFPNSAGTFMNGVYPDVERTAGANQMFYSCHALTGFSNGLHLGTPTGLVSTFAQCNHLIEAPDLTSRGGSLSSVKTYAGCFQSNELMTGYNFDMDITSASSAYATFYGCKALRSWKPWVGSTAKLRDYWSVYGFCSAMGSYGRNGQLPRTYESCHVDMDFSNAWSLKFAFGNCSSLRSLGEVDCSSIDGSHVWPDLASHQNGGNTKQFAHGCTNLTGLNLTNTSKIKDIDYMFAGDSNLSCINTGGAAVDFTSAEHAFDSFFRCWKLGDKEPFPTITFGKCGNFKGIFYEVGRLYPSYNGSLKHFPSLDYGTGLNGVKNFGAEASDDYYDLPGHGAWQRAGMSSFGAPLNNSFEHGNFNHAWSGARELTHFPANAFDNNTGTGYHKAFNDTSLSYASIENVVVSIDTAGASNGTLGLTNFSGVKPYSSWTAAAKTSLNNLLAKGWSIEYTT